MSILIATFLVDGSVQLPAHAANDAVLNQLERLKRDELSSEVRTPALTRLGRIEVFASQDLWILIKLRKSTLMMQG
jgi:hypothetical protein